ncbi:MAG: rmlC [Acidobacteria bacterium]|jgi:dTDP-4-dehydrorhamnose 3,5-epimerase|nr:rmlC [Acidobacteriota bacterium]
MRRPIHELSGIRTLKARRFTDERGFLLQSYTQSCLLEAGIRAVFRQAIQSRSRHRVLRGLHFQWDPPQDKLIRCIRGTILDVVVDVRPGSPSLGDHAAVELSETNDATLWVPAGFAHGFMALADDSIVLYECTAEWAPVAEGGILWCDPALAIEWPDPNPIVSEKDRGLPTLASWLSDPRSQAFRLSGEKP